MFCISCSESWTVLRVMSTSYAWNAPLSPWESLWACEAHGKIRRNVKKKQRRGRIRLSSPTIHSSSVKYVIISPEEQHSSSCLYSALSSVNVWVFVFSAASKSRSLFHSHANTHTHTHTNTRTHTHRQFINRDLWSSAVASRNLTTTAFFILPPTFNNNLM